MVPVVSWTYDDKFGAAGSVPFAASVVVHPISIHRTLFFAGPGQSHQRLVLNGLVSHFPISSTLRCLTTFVIPFAFWDRGGFSGKGSIGPGFRAHLTFYRRPPIYYEIGVFRFRVFSILHSSPHRGQTGRLGSEPSPIDSSGPAAAIRVRFEKTRRLCTSFPRSLMLCYSVFA